MITESELNGGGVFNVERATFTAGIKQRPPQPHGRCASVPVSAKLETFLCVFHCVSLVFHSFSLFSSQHVEDEDEDDDDLSNMESSRARGLTLGPLDVANQQVKAARLDFDHIWF